MATSLDQILGYGRDFAQGASNSAASTVSAPVDGIAWLLRKAGLDVGEPVGGSDWMARKGLTAQPENALAGLLGESAGMVAPIMAAAKGPQIANALNQMVDNAAARPTLNPQTGALVIAPNRVQKDKLAEVMAEMEARGAPDIRAVWDDGMGAYRALEGSHRLEAARRLGLTPNMIEMNPREWLRDHDFWDLPEKSSVARALKYLDGPAVYKDFPDLPDAFR